MAISTNGTVIARLAGGLYNTVISNATYLEVAATDPSTLANTLYSRDFASKTDLAVATTLVKNLGLTSVTGLDNWVAAQLTAAGSAKGAKIVSLLNDFAGLTADTTYGAFATAFNTKVDAALALAQKTGSVEGVFSAAGAAAGASFTLTTGIDGLDKFTGGAGDDTFNATNADLGVLDSISGGAGTDTLSIVDSVSIPARNITASSIEKVVVSSSAGSIGSVAADAKVATKEKITYTFAAANETSVGTGPVKVTVGGASVTAVNATATNAVLLSEIVTAINDLAGSTIASTASTNSIGTITVTSGTAGTALPVITLAAGTYRVPGATTDTTNTGWDIAPAANYSYKTTVISNQAAAASVAASTFAVPTGATSASLTAKTEVAASAPATADVTAKGTVVKVSGGLSQTITASNSAQASGSAGDVKVTATLPTTALAAVTDTGWTEAAGVFVRGGKTVTVTETAGTFAAGTAAPGNGTKVQIGSNPASASNSTNSTVPAVSSSGFPTEIGNLADAPTGDVSVSVKTNFTDDNGSANITYGSGAVEVYMNGGATASVTGAGTVLVRDLQTVPTLASSSATAAPANASNLKTVNLTGVSAAAAVYTDAISTISIIDSTTTATLYSNTGKNKTALNVSVGNSTATVDAGNATSVAVTGVQSANAKIGTANVTATNSASSLTLTTGEATGVSFAGSSDITLASSTLTKAATISASGSGKLDLGTPTGYSKVTTIDGSAATGGITANIGATITGASTDRGFAFIGGAGNDSVTLSGSIKSGTSALGASIANTINLGAGDDSLIYATNGEVAAGSSVDGGAGTDTISARLLNGGNSAQITNFERLGLDAANTFDTDLLVGATGFTLLAAAGKTYVNAEKEQSLYINKDVAGTTNTTTLSFTASNVAGTADAYAINFGADGGSTAGTIAAIDAGVLVVAGIENATINSGAAKGFVNNTITLTAANLKTVTITGAAAKTTLAFTGTNGTNTSSGGAVKTIDASAATGAVVLNTTNLTVDNAASGTGLTITTGSGKDAITIGNAGVTTISTGAGDDVITTTTEKVTLTLGDGKDTVNVATSVVATFAVGVTVATEALATARLITVTDIASGDTIDFDTATTAGVGATLGAKTSTGSAQTLLEALNALSNVAGTGVTWGQYGGNTYIVYDAGDTATGIQANDIVVKLSGLVDLTLSSYGATAGALLIV